MNAVATAVATAVAIVVLTPAKNLNKVFWGSCGISERDMTQKN